jgi:hypothetical protein
MRLAGGGLLLGCFEDQETCYSNLELRRLDSGELAWPNFVQTGGKNFERPATRATVLDKDNDRLLFASDKQLWALDLAQGLVKDVGSFEFDFREKPESILALRDGAVVLAGQNIAGFSRDGGECQGQSKNRPVRRRETRPAWGWNGGVETEQLRAEAAFSFGILRGGWSAG